MALKNRDQNSLGTQFLNDTSAVGIVERDIEEAVMVS